MQSDLLVYFFLLEEKNVERGEDIVLVVICAALDLDIIMLYLLQLRHHHSFSSDGAF